MGSDLRRDASTRLPHVAFVLERHLGHKTYADYLRSELADVPHVATTWTSVDYEPTDAWWERIPVDEVRELLRGRREVNRGLTNGGVDVVVYNTQVPVVIGGRTARRAPYVVCTDVTPVQFDGMAQGYDRAADRNGLVGKLKYRWNRRVLQRAAAHAPWSGWVRTSLIDDYGVDPSRIEVIPPGVDTDVWRPGVRIDDVMTILFVGGDFERKGGDDLLEAFSRLPVGTARLEIVTRSEIAERPGVRVHRGLGPNDPELIELYERSDVFVLPSRHETFGIAAIEAGASGLALVVSDVGGLGGLVVDGETGFVMRDGSADELALYLRRLADDVELRRRLGASARRRAEREFDATVNARRLLDLALGCVAA